MRAPTSSLLFLLPLLLASSCSGGKGSNTPMTQPPAALMPAPGEPHLTPPPAKAHLEVENLSSGQEIPRNADVLFRITASSDVQVVKITANGRALGKAESNAGEFRFKTKFVDAGDLDLEFTGYGAGKSEPVARAEYRVHVLGDAPPPPPSTGRLFNPYVLKAVAYLNDNWGLLGYNINSEFTHMIPFYKYGSMEPSHGGQTMCVAGVLEVILTAFDIYLRETSDHSLFDFLPFHSWNSLSADTVKANIWVNPKLHSAGTGDAVEKFGLGEKIKFRDLEPGGFININRTTGTGHAVVFLGFLDNKGRDLPRYGADVAGFKYFGAQGRAKKGEGGFGYRHAFFSKNGCPKVPFARDCNVIFSEDSRLLNVGQMYMPSQWKHKALTLVEDEQSGQSIGAANPAEFDGITTDD